MMSRFLLYLTWFLIPTVLADEDLKCEPDPSMCENNNNRCPDAACKYEDPFYCGCCPQSACLKEEGESCGGDRGDCGQGLTCDTSSSNNGEGTCAKCEFSDEVCAEKNVDCPDEECRYGFDPLACSCCPVCLKGSGESCSANERCTFYTKCIDGKCQETKSDIPASRPTNGKESSIQTAGAKKRKRVCRRRYCVYDCNKKTRKCRLRYCAYQC